MATKLFKLVVDASTTTNTDINPAVEKYFYEVRADELADDILTIPAVQFTDDAGDAVAGNLTTVAADNGYYLLFINGVLQQTSLYTVSGDGSQVVVTEADTIPLGAAIILIVNNFAPSSTSTTTVTT